MNDYDRRDFLKKVSILAVASAVMPRFLLGNSNSGNVSAGNQNLSKFNLPDAGYDDFGIVDLHCHPAQKMYLLNKNFWRRHFPIPGENIFRVQIDTRQLDKGYYKGLVANHYLPEISMTKKSDTLKFLFPWFKRFKINLTTKLEYDDMRNFQQVIKMMNQLEEQVCISNKYYGAKIVIALNYKDFENAINNGKIPFAHAIEGSHALGRMEPNALREREAYQLASNPNLTSDTAIENQYKKDLAPYKVHPKKGEAKKMIAKLPRLDEPEQTILNNLKTLKDRGLCLITLAHFFPNDLISYPTEGISYASKRFTLQMGPQFDPVEEKTHTLTPFGEVVVNKMFEMGIVVDITHTNPTARKRIFELNKAYNLNNPNKPKRPVVFSHSGVQSLFNPNVKYVDYKYYNADDEEIGLIKECGGVIGVIPEVFWLTGCDTHLPDVKRCDYHYGIKYMLNTMDYIYQKTGTYDNIGIGSDFDGLADCPKDLYVPSQFGNLIKAMHEHGIPYDDIKKITHGNAMRVLKYGWGEQ